MVPLVLLVHKLQEVVKMFFEVQGTLSQVFEPYERVRLVVR